MILKKSKIKIPYIRLDFRIVRQSDARWCERTAASHRLLLACAHVSALHIITPRMRCASPQRILPLADSSPGIADGVRLPILTSAVSAFRSPAHAARALYTAGARPR